MGGRVTTAGLPAPVYARDSLTHVVGDEKKGGYVAARSASTPVSLGADQRRCREGWLSCRRDAASPLHRLAIASPPRLTLSPD